tara:strand:- start:15023 stop:15325 length:303 start_codon:yes stop_codon:yes gene_type:complete
MILEYKKIHNISINNHLYKLKNIMKEKLKKGRIKNKQKPIYKIYKGQHFPEGTDMKELGRFVVEEYKNIINKKNWEKYNTITGEDFLRGYKIIKDKYIKL